jgi:4-hydroxy-tetrahydrodipicolinate synthase
MEFTKSEAKQWAKKNFKGLECVMLPSFTPDLASLDEEGIRWDVQYLIKQGYFSILCAVELSELTIEERKQFMRIVCDEAKGKIKVSVANLYRTVDEAIEMLNYFEKVGGDSALFLYPLQFFPKSEEEIFQVTKKVCASTNLAIVLYANHRFDFERFHPSMFNPRLLARMADFENAVALKVGILDSPGYIEDCFRLCGDKVLVESPIEDNWPITVPHYNQQWAGAGVYDPYQTPDNPRLVNFFNLLKSGQIDKAMDIYWELTPIRRNMAFNTASYGIRIFNHAKYKRWLVGGNGGMLRDQFPIRHDEMKMIREAMKAGGLKIREASDEEFFVGRLNYAKGYRSNKTK